MTDELPHLNVLHDQSDEEKGANCVEYTMTGQVREAVEHYPYLGVELANDLSLSHHLKNCIQKAHGVIFNVLRRNLSKCTVVTKETAYKSMIRLHVEYTSSALNLGATRSNTVKGNQICSESV